MSVNAAPEATKAWRIRAGKYGLWPLVTEVVPGDSFVPTLARWFCVFQGDQSWGRNSAFWLGSAVLFMSCMDMLLSLAI